MGCGCLPGNQMALLRVGGEQGLAGWREVSGYEDGDGDEDGKKK